MGDVTLSADALAGYEAEIESLNDLLLEISRELDRAGAPPDQSLPNRVRQLQRQHVAQLEDMQRRAVQESAVAPVENARVTWPGVLAVAPTEPLPPPRILELLRACYQELRLLHERSGGLSALLESTIERLENPTAPPKQKPLTVGVDKEQH